MFGEMYFIVQLLTAASVESINSSSSTSEIGKHEIVAAIIIFGQTVQ